MFAVTIWDPGQVLIFVAILIGVAMHLSKKYASPEVKDAAKKAAAAKAISLIGKWFK